MKTAVVGVVAVCTVIALRPVVRRAGNKMRQRCEQMAAHCGGRSPVAGA